MQILKNKHMILAMFVAPVLAIVAYFSVDYVVSEEPQAALQGGTYKLAAKSNCRYQSGVCTLKNGDIEVQIHARRVNAGVVELTMHSDQPVQNILISSVVENMASEPVQIGSGSAGIQDWQMTLSLDDPDKTLLRLAMNISGSMYYAETTAVFVDYKTAFSQDNFSK